MKKTLYILVSIIIVILTIWFGFNYFKNNEAKKVFQEYITINYSEAELSKQNDIIARVALKNPELFANLVSEALSKTGKQSIPPNKVLALLSVVSYSASVGMNEKVFDILLRNIAQLTKSDPQNTDRYLYDIEYYFVQSTMSCARTEIDFRSDSMIERCREKNTPYVLVYNFLGKYGDLIDKKLIQCATKLTLNDGINRGVLFPHYWVLALRQRYGNNITTEVLKNDPIIQKTGGNIPNELKKELGI